MPARSRSARARRIRAKPVAPHLVEVGRRRAVLHGPVLASGVTRCGAGAPVHASTFPASEAVWEVRRLHSGRPCLSGGYPGRGFRPKSITDAPRRPHHEQSAATSSPHCRIRFVVRYGRSLQVRPPLEAYFGVVPRQPTAHEFSTDSRPPSRFPNPSQYRPFARPRDAPSRSRSRGRHVRPRRARRRLRGCSSGCSSRIGAKSPVG